MESENNSTSEKEEEKSVELPLLEFFRIHFFCFLFPLYVCLGLFLLFEYYFIVYFSIPLLVHLLLLPGFFLFLYYIYLIVLIEFAAFWVRRWNKKSPPEQGIFNRVLNDVNSKEGEIIKYYHKRGFIIKFPMWFTSKSPFPWLLNRALKRIGHNKIGKNVIYCDSYAGLEFIELSDNTFVYPTSGVSSHAVNSIFGKLTISEVKLGKNAVIYPGSIVGCGAILKDNYVIYPNTILHKNWRGKPDKAYYQGSPGKPIEVSNFIKNEQNKNK